MTTMLRLDGLRKAYGGAQALRGLDLDVRENEIFALLGPTGAGKSSTLLASAGLIQLDGGNVQAELESGPAPRHPDDAFA